MTLSFGLPVDLFSPVCQPTCTGIIHILREALLDWESPPQLSFTSLGDMRRRNRYSDNVRPMPDYQYGSVSISPSTMSVKSYKSSGCSARTLCFPWGRWDLYFRKVDFHPCMTAQTFLCPSSGRPFTLRHVQIHHPLSIH